MAHFGIEFNELFALTNMPIQRFGSMLISKGQFNDYMQLLRDNFSEPQPRPRDVPQPDQRRLARLSLRLRLQPATGPAVASGGAVRMAAAPHLRDLLMQDPAGRPVRVAEHCYGCTAGQGSSCGGALKGA